MLSLILFHNALILPAYGDINLSFPVRHSSDLLKGLTKLICLPDAAIRFFLSKTLDSSAVDGTNFIHISAFKEYSLK